MCRRSHVEVRALVRLGACRSSPAQRHFPRGSPPELTCIEELGAAQLWAKTLWGIEVIHHATGNACDPTADRPVVREYDPHAGNGRRAEGELRSSGHANGHGPGSVLPVAAVSAI